MRGSSVDTSTPFTSLPLVIDETSSRSSPVVLTSVLAPLLAGLALPFVLVGSALITQPAMRAAVLERPMAAAQLVIASLALLALFGWPLLRLIGSAGGRRVITIDAGVVAVAEHGPFGRATWSEPLKGYSGLAHRVSSSLSGVRHELVLVHADHRRTLPIWVAPLIAQEDVAGAARLLNLAEISSREAFSEEPLRRRLGPSRPRPQFTVAALSAAKT